MEFFGWAGNAVLICGSWKLGNKDRTGFLLIVAGELIWSLAAWQKGSWSMLFICVVFTLMALRNWARWAKIK